MALLKYIVAFVREAILGKLTVAEAFRYAPKRAITFVIFNLLLIFSSLVIYRAPEIAKKMQRMENAEKRVIELVEEVNILAVYNAHLEELLTVRGFGNLLRYRDTDVGPINKEFNNIMDLLDKLNLNENLSRSTKNTKNTFRG